MTDAQMVNINITFKNTEATEPLKTYANDKLSNVLRKFAHKSVEAHIVLRVEKNRHIAEASFRNDGADFACKEESADLYASIDALADSITQQLRRHKEKLTKHH